MSSLLNDPGHSRERAQEARKIANESDNVLVRRSMIKIVEEYEMLARKTEERVSKASPDSNRGLSSRSMTIKETPAG
jgi:hypothetical protein